MRAVRSRIVRAVISNGERMVAEIKSDEKSAVTKKSTATKKTVKKTVVKKKVAKKTVAKKSAVAKKAANTGQNLFSQRDRYEMIGKMAYFRAEKRGFEPGWEQDDWYESEKRVDGMLSKT